MTRIDPYQHRARELCAAAGIDPDSRVGEGRGQPAWCAYRTAARAEQMASEQQALASATENDLPDVPLTVVGDHEAGTVTQMQNCLRYGPARAGVLCADGHLGYAQPVGGVVAYENAISISGVGFDIGCGNMAVKLDIPASTWYGREMELAREIAGAVSFGVGRVNEERVEDALFDDDEAWKASGIEDYKTKARHQLGTVGSGNHYVDVMAGGDGSLWIGVHFGSRGLGHTTATRFLKLAGGVDGMNVPPTVVGASTDLGQRYLAGMDLAGRYAYAGRAWVVERVRRITGGDVLDSVHNHHNFAWLEVHGGASWWVVRKGATPAFPGQRGFVGGSMGDDCVILEGVESERSAAQLYSTVHGAGRLFGRKEAKRRFTKAEWHTWLNDRRVTVVGGDLDESPMAYRRLPDVLAFHADTVRVTDTLRPFVVVMAGAGEVDPWKD